jgi:uncharacterized membrane protein
MIIKNIHISNTCTSFEEFHLCYKLNTFCVSNGGFYTGMLFCSVVFNAVVAWLVSYMMFVYQGEKPFKEGLTSVTISINETKAFRCLFRMANISETD